MLLFDNCTKYLLRHDTFLLSREEVKVADMLRSELQANMDEEGNFTDTKETRIPFVAKDFPGSYLSKGSFLC